MFCAPEAILVVTTSSESKDYEHLVDRGQRCYKHPPVLRTVPTTENYLAPYFNEKLVQGLSCLSMSKDFCILIDTCHYYRQNLSSRDEQLPLGQDCCWKEAIQPGIFPTLLCIQAHPDNSFLRIEGAKVMYVSSRRGSQETRTLSTHFSLPPLDVDSDEKLSVNRQPSTGWPHEQEIKVCYANPGTLGFICYSGSYDSNRVFNQKYSLQSADFPS